MQLRIVIRSSTINFVATEYLFKKPPSLSEDTNYPSFCSISTMSYLFHDQIWNILYANTNMVRYKNLQIVAKIMSL